MNERFDELAKGMAQSVTRRGALKRFGVGLAAFALAALGLAPPAQAGSRGLGEPCDRNGQCRDGLWCTKGVCSTTGGPGTYCSTHADCAVGLLCVYASAPGSMGRLLCREVKPPLARG